MAFIQLGQGLSIHQKSLTPKAKDILTPEVVKVLAFLNKELAPEREFLLRERVRRQMTYDNGVLPGYLPHSREVHDGNWKIAALPEDLKKRRVEITGPVNSRKMVIQMLSRGKDGQRADTAMLDFEDSMCPTWENVLDGVHNVLGVAKGHLIFPSPAAKKAAEKGIKTYKLDPKDMAVPMVRVRGLHLEEEHIMAEGRPLPAGLFDLAVNFVLTAKIFLKEGRTPKYYIPKCEHFLEARWWNRLFTLLEKKLGIQVGTLKATFLIETLEATFQIEEILYEIKEHAAGLNCGRWDKIFSDIKVLKNHPDRVMPDRSFITMERSWMENYAKRLIKICHKRGAYALGGMAAQTPGKDEQTKREQRELVFQDKLREFQWGHDGCWVSHPFFIGDALKAFSKENQLEKKLEDFPIKPNLLPETRGPKTLEGLRKNIRVGIAYQKGWNEKLGCISWDNQMEDLATLEISRAQVWQWKKHKVRLDDGHLVDDNLIEKIFVEETQKILEANAQAEKKTNIEDEAYQEASKMALNLYLKNELSSFMTLLD